MAHPVTENTSKKGVCASMIFIDKGLQTTAYLIYLFMLLFESEIQQNKIF